MFFSTIKKTAAGVLAALMLLSAIACADTSEPSKDTVNTTIPTDSTPPASADTSGESELETLDPNYVCALPDNLDFKGETVNILYPKVAARGDELVSEALGEGSISDAVYERNLKLETELGVRLAFHSQADDGVATQTISTLTQAGDDSIDLFVLATFCAMPRVLGGSYLDLSQMEAIDLDKHYWSQDYNRLMTLTSERKQFLATSPAALSLFRLTYLTIFNRDLFADRGIPDLYDTVRNGAWTLDYQYQLISDVWNDTDGDGKKSEGDFFGFITGNCVSVDAYCSATDIHMVVQDESGDLIFNITDSERLIDMSEKVSALYNTPGTYFFRNAEYDDIGKHYIIKKFAAEEGLMATTQFYGIEHNIEALSAFNYGVLPMPKLNEAQEKYMSYVQDQVSAFGISGAVTDEERTYMLGTLMEAMAYYSNESVRPAYYDTTLSQRFMQDPESSAMLDTMFETISFDYCYTTGFFTMPGELRAALSSQNPGMSSLVARWKFSYARQLTSINSEINQLH